MELTKLNGTDQAKWDYYPDSAVRTSACIKNGIRGAALQTARKE